MLQNRKQWKYEKLYSQKYLSDPNVAGHDLVFAILCGKEKIMSWNDNRRMFDG